LTKEDEYEFFELGTEVRVEKFMDEKGIEFLGAVEIVEVNIKQGTLI